MIRFREVLRCNGMDEDGSPPGIVVKVGSFNFVAVETDGADIDLKERSNAISIGKVDATVITRSVDEVTTAMAGQNVDPLMKMSYTPTKHPASTRYFRINGDREVSGTPAEVSLVARKSTVQKLHVLVVPRLTVKLAIRNVQVYNAKRELKDHSLKPVVPLSEVAAMNNIWIPQAQMEFQLISSPPAIIDDQDAATKALIAKGYGLRDPSTATFPADIDPYQLVELFEKYKVAGADLTMFLLDKLSTSTGRPDGTTISQNAMSFIAGTHFPSTFAHEAGHFLGAGIEGGSWKRFTHTYDSDPVNPKNEDKRMLMRDGGAGFKIPFKLVKKFRSFKERQATKP